MWHSFGMSLLVKCSREPGGALALGVAAMVFGGDRLRAAEDWPRVSNPVIRFSTEILPLFQSRCFGCHGGGDKIQGGLNMTSLEGLCVGGESGEAAIVPGDPAQGTLVGAVQWDGLEMPPKESERLSPEQIKLIIPQLN